MKPLQKKSFLSVILMMLPKKLSLFPQRMSVETSHTIVSIRLKNQDIIDFSSILTQVMTNCLFVQTPLQVQVNRTRSSWKRERKHLQPKIRNPRRLFIQSLLRNRDRETDILKKMSLSTRMETDIILHPLTHLLLLTEGLQGIYLHHFIMVMAYSLVCRHHRLQAHTRTTNNINYSLWLPFHFFEEKLQMQVLLDHLRHSIQTEIQILPLMMRVEEVHWREWCCVMGR